MTPNQEMVIASIDGMYSTRPLAESKGVSSYFTISQDTYLMWRAAGGNSKARRRWRRNAARMERPETQEAKP